MPELHPKDVGKRKSFDKGTLQLTDEGAIQLLRPFDMLGDCIFAAVGQLQFEVMQYRLKDEYGVETVLTPLPYQCSAWILGDLQNFKKPTEALIMKDKLDRPVVLFNSQWEKQFAIKQNPDHQLMDILA